jgi:polyketide biosynthesis acyl carrier protein
MNVTRDQILSTIVRCTREVLPHLETHEFQPYDSLPQLGANSLDRAEIVTLVLETLAMKIARAETFGPRNIGELAELLHAKLR